MELLDLTTLLVKCPVLKHLNRKSLWLPVSETAQLGIDFHKAVSLELSGQEWRSEVSPENLKLVDYLVKRAISELKLHFYYRKTEVEVPICVQWEGYRIAGIVDLILHIETGLILIDWKTTQRPQFTQSPLQLNLYAWILRKKGLTVDGLFYFKIRYTKRRGYYTCEIVPIAVPEFPDGLIEKKLSELIQRYENSDVPSLEWCGFCPLQHYCESAMLEGYYRPEDIAERVELPAKLDGVLVLNDWHENLEKQLNQEVNRYGC